jgi:hypothetical protein
MSPLSIVGIVLFVVIDLVGPAVLAAYLIRRNFRRRSSPTSERIFWIMAGIQTGVVALLAWWAVAGVLDFRGEPVIAVTAFALPLGAVPAILNSTLVHLLVTDADWAAGGYHVVLTAYVVGMVAWALLNGLVLRAVISAGRARRDARWRQG